MVTTDMEQDDLASLIRYLLYTNDLDTQGIIYSSSRYHWAGDGRGTEFFRPDREYRTPQTSWRWTGTRTIQDQVLPAYASVYPRLRRHDSAYPTPATLLSMVTIGNIAFEGEMAVDTPGSDRIVDLLLDDDPRPLYLQAWGGTNTIARALKAIEERHAGTPARHRIRAKVTAKAVILASGFQDDTYAGYLAPRWPGIRVVDLSGGYATWGYNCNVDGRGNTRGLPADREVFTGAWTRKNIQIGPYGSLYRSWLDGQAMAGDPFDVFGDPRLAPEGWCKPLDPYDFLCEGDNVAYNPLLRTGIEAPHDPRLGGWGGRAVQVSTSPNLWRLAPTEKDDSGSEIRDYTTLRWAGPVQNDFAARMRWTVTADYRAANHAPSVHIIAGADIRSAAGSTVSLTARTSDPDGDHVTIRWWQYREEGTCPGDVVITPGDGNHVTVTIPGDARPGQVISIIVQGTDDGDIPLTGYDRATITVI